MSILGITGRNCAGKDSVANLLVRRGYARHSLSDALRDELRTRGAAITRERLIAIGRELRRAEGPAVLAERMKARLRTGNATLVSIRSPHEVEALRELPTFVLLVVEAPVEVRFERERERDREGAPATLEAFRELEAVEDTSDPHAQQMAATLALADHRIVNDGTLAELEARVDTLLDGIDD